jgi:hypothetical protein
MNPHRNNAGSAGRASHAPMQPSSGQRLTAHDILGRAGGELAAMAGNCGIDWQKAAPSLGNRAVKLTRGVESEPKYRGKVSLWYEVKTAKSGQEYPAIRFYTNKHGGVTETFDGWQWLADNGHVNGQITPRQPIKQPVKPGKPTGTEAWQQRRFDAFSVDFQAMPRVGIAEGGYLARKGFAAGDLPASLDIREGGDTRGGFIAYALQSHRGETVGYQKIYGQPFTDASGKTRDKDFIFLPDKKKGSFAWLGKPSGEGEAIYICEGLASGLSVHAATGKAVAVALDAYNLGHVAKRLAPHFAVTLCADNDITAEGGNVGIFKAMQAAHESGKPKVVAPSLDGKKCDFDDVRQQSGIAAVCQQLVHGIIEMAKNLAGYYTQLIQYAPRQQLPNIIKKACSVAANKVTTRSDLRSASNGLQAAIDARSPGTNARKEIMKTLRHRIARIAATHGITCFEGIIRLDLTDNEAIAEAMHRHKGVFLDTRGMGNGKTEAMRLVAAKAKAEGLRVVYVCHRVSLTRSASERLGLDHYEGVAWQYGERPKTLSICVNSLVKHQVGDTIEGGVLFIDEARQTLEHLLNGKVDNRIEVYQELVKAIKNASLVVCADADLNQATLDWIKSIASGDIRVIVPKPGRNGKTIKELGNVGAVLNQAKDTLKAGGNVWIACDSINKTRESGVFLSDCSGLCEDEILASLSTAGISKDAILVIHAENKGDARQAEFLKNPDIESQKYRAVIHSPVISSGISITHSHFSEVYLISSGVLPSNELLQSVARVRQATAIYAAFKGTSEHNRPVDIQSLIDGETIKRGRFCKDTGALQLTDFDHLRIKSLAGRNASLNDFRAEFLILAQLRGYRIGEPSHTKANLGGLSAETKKAKIGQVLAAPLIDEKEARRLEKAAATTQKESDALALYEIVKTTGKAPERLTEDDADFCLFKGGHAAMANFALIESAMGDLMEKDIENHEHRDKLASKTSKAVYFKAVVEPLDGKEFNATAAHGICEFLAENHEELAINGLGNHARVSKYPVRQLGRFVERFGYQVVATRQQHNGQRWYALAVHPLVAEYAENHNGGKAQHMGCSL